MIAGFPFDGCGECQVCGQSFLLNIITGEKVVTGRLVGMDQDIALHLKCQKFLDGRPPEELPEGPLRKFILSLPLEETETA